MKFCLVDLNVWLALAYTRHAQHSVAMRWFENAGAAECCFCRLTQLGLLRLLTNATIMGRDIRTDLEAWAAYDELAADFRVSFIDETTGLETAFRSLTGTGRSSNHRWPDAYLGALARISGMKVVTFDRGFLAMPGVDAAILRAS